MTDYLTTSDIMARFSCGRDWACKIARRIAAEHNISKTGRDWHIPAALVEQYQPAPVGHPKGKNKMWYIIERDGQYQIINRTSDPLYGNGSWNLHSGPYDTYEQAVEACPKDK